MDVAEQLHSGDQAPALVGVKKACEAVTKCHIDFFINRRHLTAFAQHVAPILQMLTGYRFLLCPDSHAPKVEPIQLRERSFLTLDI